MINTFMKRTLSTKLALIAMVTPFLVGGSPTFAQESNRGRTCRDVYIKANNTTGEPINVIGLQYSNINARTKLGEWKVELTPNQEIPDGQPYQRTRNLESVNNLPTQIKIRYRTLRRTTRTGKNLWSFKVHEAISLEQNCTRGQVYELDI
jgi:hypothetical protein